MAKLAYIVGAGCRIHLSRPPFDHSKLLVVDGAWSLIGSASTGIRLELETQSFEYLIETYSVSLAARLQNAIIDRKLEGGGARSGLEAFKARPLSCCEAARRPLLARATMPYL